VESSKIGFRRTKGREVNFEPVGWSADPIADLKRRFQVHELMSDGLGDRNRPEECGQKIDLSDQYKVADR